MPVAELHELNAGLLARRDFWHTAPVHVQFVELDRCLGLLLGLVLVHGVKLGRVLEQVEVVPQAVVELRERYPATRHVEPP